MNSPRLAIKVVAGIIWHPANTNNSGNSNLDALSHSADGTAKPRLCPGERILLALRQAHQHQGGLWEFPGGKIDDGESGFDALKRELREEISINVIQANAWLQVSHDYPDKSVDLEFWHVTQFAGEPQGCEQQELRWVSLAELDSYQFPKANQAVVDAIMACVIADD